MNKKIEKTWQSLVEHIDKSYVDSGVTGLIVDVQKWLQDNMSQFEKTSVDTYRLSEFSKLDIYSFPTQYSEINANEEVVQLRRIAPCSLDNLAMRVRNIFWSALVYKSKNVCSNCETDCLSVLKKRAQIISLIYECETCGWTQNEDGSPWLGGSRITLPTTSELRKRGILQS